MKKVREHPARSLGFLSRYHDGELTVEERDEFVRHAAECPECGEAASEYEAVLAMYRESSAEIPDTSLASRISRRIDAELRHRAPVRFLTLEIDLLWASVVAVGLAGVLAVYGVLGHRATQAPSVFVAEKAPAEEPQRLARENAPSPPPSAAREPDSPARKIDAREREKKTTLSDGVADRRVGSLSSGPVAGGGASDRSDAGVASRLAREPALAVSPEEGAKVAQPLPSLAAPEPLRVGPGIRAPRLLYRVEPVIPESVRRGFAPSGPVIVEATISKMGDVTAVKVIRSNPAFDEPVRRAVRQWKYEPALANGVPVAVYETLTFSIDPR